MADCDGKAFLAFEHAFFMRQKLEFDEGWVGLYPGSKQRMGLWWSLNRWG